VKYALYECPYCSLSRWVHRYLSTYIEYFMHTPIKVHARSDVMKTRSLATHVYVTLETNMRDRLVVANRLILSVSVRDSAVADNPCSSPFAAAAAAVAVSGSNNS
jgi:hypothetical protein